MIRRPNAPLVALLSILALVAAACGVKSGVADQAVSTGEDGGAPAGGDGGGSGGGGAAPAAHEPGPDDSAGVTDDTIVIGVHAPVTGASPIPQTSFDVGKDIYWKYLVEKDPDMLFGRKVEIVFRDDEYNPNRAVSVCREMVEQEGAFLLVGGGGADQITACAKYADGAGVPYLSAGVNKAGLEELRTYFASTLTYAEQAPLLVDHAIASKFQNVAIVVSDTPSFDDAHDALVAAADEKGVNIALDTTLSKAPAEAEVLAIVQQLKNAKADAVLLLHSPVTYIGLAGQARNQGIDPVWFGPGITMGLNAVTSFGCPGVSKGRFLSPTPALDVINDLDPDFVPAYEKYAEGEKADDIGLQLWALNKAIALMLAETGEDLGRAAFMNTLESSDGFDNGIYAPIVFTPEDHFGGTGAHLLAADCGAKQYKTAEQFLKVG